MTPAELRALAEEATPGPWRVEGRFVRSERRLIPLVGLNRIENHLADEDAHLIALAPDLARLCAEMGEALIACVDPDHAKWPEAKFVAEVALAKLAELEAR